MQLGLSITYATLMHVSTNSTVGKHLEGHSCRQAARLLGKALTLQAAVGAMLPPENPQQIALISGYWFLWGVHDPCGLWGFPDIGDVGLYFTAQLAANVYNRYDYGVHAPLCAKLPSTHTILGHSGVDVCLARHGQVSVALQWTQKKVDMLEDASILERIRPSQPFLNQIDSHVPPIVMAIEGTCVLGVRGLAAMGLTFESAEAVLAPRKQSKFAWSATEPFPMTFLATEYYIDMVKLKCGLWSLSAAVDAVDIGAFSQWLPAPGTHGCVRGPASSLFGAYDNALGAHSLALVASPEPMAHAVLSRHTDAITAAKVSAERSPFNVPQSVVHRGVVAQCLVALGGATEALQTFDRAMAGAYDHRLYFVSVVLAAECIATGLGDRERLVSSTIGGALAAMPDADLDGLTAKVLSPRAPGVDAAAARRAHAST